MRRGDDDGRNPAALRANLDRRTLLTGGVLAAGALAGCSPGYDVRYPYRYALTLEVEADGVRRRRTNVVQVERHVRLAPGRSSGVGAILGVVITGGLNVLDVGRGRPLIAQLTRLASIWEPQPPRRWDLLTPEPILARIYGVEPDFGWDDRRGSPMLHAITEAHGEHEIGLEDLPTLVTYARPGDRSSGFLVVNPYDLAATFGPGVAIARATLAVTRRMITLSHFQRLESSPLVSRSTAPWKPAARI